MILYQKDSVTIRESVFSDVDLLADNMRQAEIDEVWAFDHLTPHAAVLTSYQESTSCFSMFYRDRIVAMFGVVPDSLLGPTASVWMLTTEVVNEMKTRFLKLSRPVIEFFNRRYAVLHNAIDARNKQAVNWVRWCGARVLPAEPYGVDGLPFHVFTFGGL